MKTYKYPINTFKYWYLALDNYARLLFQNPAKLCEYNIQDKYVVPSLLIQKDQLGIEISEPFLLVQYIPGGFLYKEDE